jgi:hypothetical protein
VAHRLRRATSVAPRAERRRLRGTLETPTERRALPATSARRRLLLPVVASFSLRARAPSAALAPSPSPRLLPRRASSGPAAGRAWAPRLRLRRRASSGRVVACGVALQRRLRATRTSGRVDGRAPRRAPPSFRRRRRATRGRSSARTRWVDWGGPRRRSTRCRCRTPRATCRRRPRRFRSAETRTRLPRVLVGLVARCLRPRAFVEAPDRVRFSEGLEPHGSGPSSHVEASLHEGVTSAT